MKKIFFLLVCSIGLIIFAVFTLSTSTAPLKGLYQSERTPDGHVIQISIQPEENSFVEYIDNREVNKGNYEVLNDNNYKLVGENQTIEIALDKHNSFEINIKKLNGGNPIVLKNLNEVPVYYSSEFNDIDKYKALIEE